MDWQVFPYTVPFYVGVALLFILGATAWRFRPAPTAVLTACLVWGISLWSIPYALGLGSTDLTVKTWFSKLEYFSIVFVPPVWLALAVVYTGRERWITRKRIALFAIVPITTLALVLTNELHHLIWREIALAPSGPFLLWEAEYGIAFWIYAAFSYGMMLFGIFVLLQSMIGATRLFQIQALSLIATAFAPLFGNLIYISGLTPFPRYLVSLTFFFAAAGFVWLLFRSQFVTLLPIARTWVLDTMSDGMLVLDDRDRIVDTNPAARALAGKEAAALIGRPVQEAFKGVLSQEPEWSARPVQEVSYTKDGQTQVIELRTSPVFDAKNQPRGRIVVLHDITVRKEAEDVLRRGREELERRVEERTKDLRDATEQIQESRHRLVSAQEEVRKDVAQQLHGPVQNRLLVVQYQLNDAIDALKEGKPGATEAVQKSVALLDEIVTRDLRAAMQRLHPSLIRINLLVALQEMAQRFQNNFRVEVRGIETTGRAQELWRTGLPERLRLAIYRVTEEALTNVLKHSGATEASVVLDNPRGGGVTVTISDNGRGFDTAAMKPGFGTLSMRDYCGAEGGTLTMESRPGQGSAVVARFPKPADARAVPDSLPETARPHGARGSATKVTTILLVDDQPDFCAYLLGMLKPHSDLRVVGVGYNGEEAVRLAKEHQPDAVLMDVEMPRMDGVKASREIRAALAETKVILMSARHEREFLEAAKAAGALDFIPKLELSAARLREALKR